MELLSKDETLCKTETDHFLRFRKAIPEIANQIIDNCEGAECFTHVNHEPIPSRGKIIEILKEFQKLLFPGYFSREKVDPANLRFKVGYAVSGLMEKMAEQIVAALRHDCFRYNKPCESCSGKGYDAAIALFKAIPELRDTLTSDIEAAYDGDPAARSHDEIIISYPGIFAITTHRIAHILHKLDIPLVPRIMSEYAHSKTGIDIHPGATIGKRFAIDHGTGVVIGETTEIGENVRVYQGVTLGALSLPKDAGNRLRGKKRHPTIEDDVIIYAGSTILGGDTVIGTRSIVGGNVWLTESVPPETMVLLESPRLIYRESNTRAD